MDTPTARRTGWAQFSPAARALSLLAVTGSLFATMVRPAAADDFTAANLLSSPLIATMTQASGTLGVPSTPLRLDFTRLFCVDEQGDGVFDLHSEPYMVVFAADVSGPVPRVMVVRSQIFSNVDGNELHYVNPGLQLWDFDGTGSPILDPDKLIFLCALMESDDGSSRADTVRNRVRSDLFAKLLAYHSAGLSRATIVSNLTNDMNVAINASRGGDDRIGGIRELRLTLADVQRARQGTEPQVTKVLVHSDSDSDYRTTFVLQTSLFVIN